MSAARGYEALPRAPGYLNQEENQSAPCPFHSEKNRAASPWAAIGFPACSAEPQNVILVNKFLCLLGENIPGEILDLSGMGAGPQTRSPQAKVVEG